MGTIIKDLVRLLYRKLGAKGYLWPLDQLCARQIEVLGNSEGQDKKTILALSPDRFVYDLEIFAASELFSVSRMPYYWQYAVMDLVRGKQYHLNNSERRQLLVNFLQSLKQLHNFDCLMSASLWYRQDIPWGEAAAEAGIPFILLHKESLKTQQIQLDQVKARARLYGPFKGTHVVVHNEPLRNTLIDCEFVAADQISSLGAIRMDRLAKKLNVQRDESRARNQAVLFSFPHRADGVMPDEMLTGQLGAFPNNPYSGWVRLFESTHTAFARAALAMPDAKFVIKLKWERNWIQKVKQALSSNGINVEDIPNLSISASIDTHDLIYDSQVVCGFNSTTVLEAGVFDKTVVIPHFDEPTRLPYSLAVKNIEMYRLFEIANSPEILTDLIVDRLQHRKHISDEDLRKRREYFENWVSPLDGNVSKRYIELVDRLT